MSKEEITSSKSPKEDDVRVLMQSADISSSQSRMESKDDVSLTTTHKSNSIEIPSPEFHGYLEDILHQEEITPCQSPVEGKDGVSLKSTDMSSSIEISSADFRNYLDDILQKETTPCQSPIEDKDDLSIKPAGGSKSKEISNTESRNHYGDVLKKEIITVQSRMECKVDVSKVSRDITSAINISNTQTSNNLKDILQNDDIASCQSSKECKDDKSLKSTNISSSTGISNTGLSNLLDKALQIEEITSRQSSIEGKDDVSLKSTDISSSIEISSTEFRNYLEDILQNTEITPCQSPRKSNDSISMKHSSISNSLENSNVKSLNHLENVPQTGEVTKCQSQKESKDDSLAEYVPLPCCNDVSTTQLNNYVQNLIQENSSDFLSSSTEGSIITSDFSEELLTEDSVSNLAGIQHILARELHGKLKHNDIMHVEVMERTDLRDQAYIYDIKQTSNGTVARFGAREDQFGEGTIDSHCVLPNVLVPVSFIDCQPVASCPDSRKVITRAQILNNSSETECIREMLYSLQTLSNLPIINCTDRQRLAGDYDSQHSVRGIQDQESLSEIHGREMFDSHHDRLNVIHESDINDRQRLAGISESQTPFLATQIMDGTTESDRASFRFDIQHALPMVLASNDVTDRQHLAEISDSQTAFHVIHVRDGETDNRHLTSIPDTVKDVRSVQAPDVTNEIASIDHVLDNQSAKSVVPPHGYSSQGQNEVQLGVEGKYLINQEDADVLRIKGTLVENIISMRTDEAERKKAEIQDQTVQVLKMAKEESERKAEKKFTPRLSMANEQRPRIVPIGLSMSAPVLGGLLAKSKTGVIDETDKMPRDGKEKENNVSAAKKKDDSKATEHPPAQDENTDQARNVKQDFDVTGFSHFKAENLTEEQIQEFKVAFAMHDTDADGHIKTTELRTIMRSLGMNPSKEDIKRIIQKLDVDESGSIKLPEFLNLMARKIKISETEEEILSAFKVFDNDEDGYIDVADFRNMMLSRGDEMSQEDVDEMIRDIDPQGTGRINGAEFARLVLGK